MYFYRSYALLFYMPYYFVYFMCFLAEKKFRDRFGRKKILESVHTEKNPSIRYHKVALHK
ncbi:MAG: hypothetical protein EBT51_10220 [Flavobacteriaceae bacterium]|nr:hypothetical protein [Flavobacteriaceae bacterium]